MSDLLSSLKEASGALDTEAIGRVICAALAKPYGEAMIGCGDDGSDELVVLEPDGTCVWTDYRSRAPDVSVDAALALVERVLPGWLWKVSCSGDSEPGKFDALLMPPRGRDVATRAPTPALALCIALLQALETSHDQ